MSNPCDAGKRLNTDPQKRQGLTGGRVPRTTGQVQGRCRTMLGHVQKRANGPEQVQGLSAQAKAYLPEVSCLRPLGRSEVPSDERYDEIQALNLISLSSQYRLTYVRSLLDYLASG